MWACSDNANPAVSVSTALGLRIARCLAHIVVIPIKRLLVDGYVNTPLSPRLLAAYETMREFALYYYKKADHSAAWHRVMRRHDSKGAPPKIDTSKWESILTLAQHYRDNKPQWEWAAAEIADHPPALAPGQANLVLSTIPALELIWATLLHLQGDGSLAAIYKPLIAALILALNSLPEAGIADGFVQLFIVELRGTEQRHFSQAIPATPEPGSTRVHAGWSSFDELLDCMAMCLPAYRQGLWLETQLRHARQRRLGAAFLAYFMFQHGLTDPAALLPPHMGAPIHAATHAATHAASPGTAGVADLLARMHEISGATPGRTEPASTMSTRPLTVASFVTHQVTMWFEQGPSQDNWQEFWRNTQEWSALRPGAYALLSHAAANGFPERVFSTSSDWLARKRLILANFVNKLMLKYNGAVLGMSGYSPAPVPTQPQNPQPQQHPAAADEGSSEDLKLHRYDINRPPFRVLLCLRATHSHSFTFGR